MAARPKAPQPINQGAQPINQKERSLVRGDGEIVAHGETYTSKQSCEHGIQVVKRIAPAPRSWT
jgi:hypothetical protein